jgi:hypothetical protein
MTEAPPAEASLGFVEPSWIIAELARNIPLPLVADPVAWAEEHVKLVGSARTERYDRNTTPWTTEPIRAACSGLYRSVTFVKPVQAGGSNAGEIVLCYWIATASNGWVQYNWEDDEKAKDRFSQRVEPIFLACNQLMARAPARGKLEGKWTTGEIIFPHLVFKMQGAWSAKNLDSDTIRFQVNEEVHNWKEGRLAKAYNRTTAVWNSVVFNISNAGKENDQLHQKFKEGTQQHWDVRCPGCGEYHVLRTRWDEKEPEKGGLRYDAEGCRLDDGTYNYEKLRPTIRYQFPCGETFPDNEVLRRQLSLTGRYGEPTNKGANAGEVSYTLDAVSVDYIPWWKLIQEKHSALRALRQGDPEPWIRYTQERESRFWTDEDRPVMGIVRLNEQVKKRDGLPNRAVRFGALDWQQGHLAKGEFEHWWGLIRDFDAQGNSLLVAEKKLLTDEDAAAFMKEHGVIPSCVCVDSGAGVSTMHVYQFCLRHGFDAIKGTDQAFFFHTDKLSGQNTRRIFSPERFLYQMISGGQRTRDNITEEPLFWLYSKAGIADRLDWLRSATEVKWEVPGDVSKDYRSHMESWQLRERKLRTGETVKEYEQVKKNDHLLILERYIACNAERAGLIASGAK